MLKNIMDSIVNKINMAFPHHTIYCNKIGKGFERPSFYIYFISTKQNTFNNAFTNKNILVQIVYFDSQDKFNNTDKLRQLEIGQVLLDIFSDITLITEKGSIEIKDVFSDFTVDDDMFIQITLEQLSYKTPKPKEGDNQELMEEILFNIQEV